MEEKWIFFTFFVIIALVKMTIYEVIGINVVQLIIDSLEILVSVEGVLITGLLGFIGAVQSYFNSQHFGIPFQFTKTTFSLLIQNTLESIFVFLAMIVTPVLIATWWQTNCDNGILRFVLFSIMIAFCLSVAVLECLTQFTVKKIRIAELEKKELKVILIFNIIIAIILMYVLTGLEHLFESNGIIAFVNSLATTIFILYITVVFTSIIKKMISALFGGYAGVEKCKDVGVVEFDNKKYFLALMQNNKEWIILPYKESIVTKERKIFKNMEFLTFEFVSGEFIVKNIEGLKITIMRDVLLKEKKSVSEKKTI